MAGDGILIDVDLNRIPTRARFGPPRGPLVVCRAWLVLLAVVVAPLAAEARQRAVLMSFTGPKSRAVYQSVRDAFRKQSEVEALSATALLTAAGRLGYSRRDLRDPITLSVVAAEIQADAIVHGSVLRKGRSSNLHLKVLDGGSGEVLGHHRVRLRRGRMDRSEARRAVNALLPLIRKGRWQPSDGDVDDLGFEAEEDPLFAPVDDLGIDRAGNEPYGAIEALAPEGPARREDGGTGGGEGPGTGDLLFSAGLAELTRSYDLTGASPAHRYDSGFFPGLWVHAELYPFALAGEGGTLEQIALEGYLDSGLIETKLKIQREGAPATVEGVETTQRMWGVGAVYRTFPTSTDHGPVNVRFLAGWHSATFALEEGTDLYRRIDYGAVRLGVDGLYPVGRSDAWIISLRGRAALLWSRADLNDREAYPTSSGVGWEGAGGVDVDLGGDFSVAADYRFYAFPVEFPAAGEGRPALDSDDLYHGVVLELAYRR